VYMVEYLTERLACKTFLPIAVPSLTMESMEE